MEKKDFVQKLRLMTATIKQLQEELLMLKECIGTYLAENKETGTREKDTVDITVDGETFRIKEDVFWKIVKLFKI